MSSDCERKPISPARISRLAPAVQSHEHAWKHAVALMRAAGIRFAVWVLALASPLALLPARAQAPDLGEIHGLKLGLKAPSMTMDGFGELAGGSNGGAPPQRA